MREPALPLAAGLAANPLSIADVRFYAEGDETRLAALGDKIMRKRLGAKSTAAGGGAASAILAISGGSDEGAFGAGLLVGWSARGDRPIFAVVTGISTGALIAPFAFLGSEYDTKLRAVYTQISQADVLAKRPLLLAAVGSDALADSSPLRALIARYVDAAMLRRIAGEYGKGRLLLIGTTNLDQSRAVIWNIGAIAQSNHPRARELIVDILLASASLPGVFPPVMLDVAIGGKRYQEMHVDGGVVTQAFLYPPSIRLSDFGRTGVGEASAYIIRNGRLNRLEERVERTTLDVTAKALSTMTAAGGMNDLYRIYLTTSRDNVAFKLAFIDQDFLTPYSGPFNTSYMRSLFAYGYAKGRAGFRWRTVPPGYKE